MHSGDPEQTLVKKLAAMVDEQRKQGRIPGLKLCTAHLNLARKSFTQVWETWWKGRLPPKLEIDLVLAFEDHSKLVDDALLLAVEAEYFKAGKRGNFYVGLDQVLAFAVFGFDGLVLWHLFRGVERSTVESYSSAVREVLDGFSLPIVYFACELADDWKLKCIQPSAVEGDVVSTLRWMRNHFDDSKRRNPLLFKDRLPAYRPELAHKIKQRRRTLKTVLGIP
jgi:hypothetical protein